jgi:hypothetical protein
MTGKIAQGAETGAAGGSEVVAEAKKGCILPLK